MGDKKRRKIDIEEVAEEINECFSADVNETLPEFCGAGIIFDFELDGEIENIYSVTPAAKTLAAKMFVDQYRIVAPRMLICDIVGEGMHKHITGVLPSTYTYNRWKINVVKGKPYINPATHNRVRIDILEFTRV